MSAATHSKWPCGYTPEIGEKICQLIAEGKTLRQIAALDGMPSPPTIVRWALEKRGDFAERYARAREIGWELMADALVDIADDGANDWMQDNDPENPGYRVNGEHQARSRLRAETRKWVLSKRVPKTFGDRTVLAGDPEAPLIPPETRREPAEFLAAWRKSQEAKKDE